MTDYENKICSTNSFLCKFGLLHFPHHIILLEPLYGDDHVYCKLCVLWLQEMRGQQAVYVLMAIANKQN